MAEEQHQKPAPEVAASSTVVEEVVEVIPPEKPITENEPAPAPAPEPEPEAPEKPVTFEELVEGEKATSIEEKEKTKPSEEAVNVAQSDSFKEESYVVGELPDLQKKALDELKQLIQDALNKHEFTAPPPPPPPPKEEEKKEEKKEEKEKSPVAAAAEEVKEESKTEEVKEESKTEEVKEEASKLEEEVAEAKKEEEEEKELIALVTPKVEQEASSSITIEAKVEEEEEKVTPPPPPPPTEEVVAVVVEKETSIVDEDGAKTVEEIKETIVEVSAPPPPPTAETEEPKEEITPPPAPEEVSIWGIPLLQDERSDVILLKFLRARDYKVKDAFTMIKNTVRWRKEFEIDALLEQDHGNDWDKVAFTHGYDKKGHPVCYNAFSEFQNKDLYQNTFSTDEKRQKFLKWRIQFLENSIRKLDFSPTGISSFVQVNDFKNSFGIGKRELWQATKLAVQLLQDNYPEFLAKQVHKF